MSEKVASVLFAGLGGQGIILASDLLTEAAFRMGCDVKKSELHGMSQRGGSVSSDVRFGEKVLSPMIPIGGADYLIAVSEDQIDVMRPYLNAATIVIRRSELSEEDAKSRMANIALLGVLNRHIGFPLSLWEELIRESFPETIAEENLAAFRRGMNG